jgi:mRNA interferase MazF
MNNAANKFILRGSIWLVDLDPVQGHEQGKTRPCLVISDNRFNDSKAELLVVVPLTSKVQKNFWSIKMPSKDTGLKGDSYILCAQITTISKKRLCSNSPIGLVKSNYLSSVESRLKYLLGFD